MLIALNQGRNMQLKGRGLESLILILSSRSGFQGKDLFLFYPTALVVGKSSCLSPILIFDIITHFLAEENIFMFHLVLKAGSDFAKY